MHEEHIKTTNGWGQILVQRADAQWCTEEYKEVRIIFIVPVDAFSSFNVQKAIILT